MAPSEKKKSHRCKLVMGGLFNILSNFDLKHIEGSKIAQYGDYLCSICRTFQGCTLGVAIVSEDMSIDTLGNIFVEMGLMQGFGKPVVLFADKQENVPSDFIRDFVILFNRRQYLSKFEELIQEFLDRAHQHLITGDAAFKMGDYEKASRYYKEAYLIDPKTDALKKINELVSTLNKKRGIPSGYKKRLLDDANAFSQEASRPT